MLLGNIIEVNCRYAFTDEDVKEELEWLENNLDERFVLKWGQMKETVKNNNVFYNKFKGSVVTQEKFWKELI